MVVESASWENSLLDRKLGKFPYAKDITPHMMDFDMISARIPLYDTKSIRLLLKLNAQYVDTLVNFRHKPVYGRKAYLICKSENEKFQLIELAKKIMVLRYHYDFHFSKMECDKLVEAWMRNNIEYDTVIIVKQSNYVIGFITCTEEDDIGNIDLLGVDFGWRGRGIGVQLVKSALNYFYNCDMEIVRVSAHLENSDAIQLYKKMKFTRTNTMADFHLWSK